MRRMCIALFIVWLALIGGLVGGSATAQTDETKASKDSHNARHAKNLCMNCNFEQLQEAAGRSLPQQWSEISNRTGGLIEVSDEVFRSGHSLHLKANVDQIVGMTSAVMSVRRGSVRFHYKAVQSTVDGQNLAFSIMALSRPQGEEVARRSYSPPKQSVADGQWHEGTIDFDFDSTQSRYCQVSATINGADLNKGEGEWLINAVEVFSNHVGPEIKVQHLWSDMPLARAGDTVRLSAFIENPGELEAKDVRVELEAPTSFAPYVTERRVPAIAPGSYRRLDWNIKADKEGPAELKVEASIGSSGGAAKEELSYKILVIGRNANYTRQELITDEVGYWRLLARPATLQQNNPAPLTAVKHLKSSEIKHNPYGINTQLPRSKDYEDPFNPSHLIDGNPETCWSSQQNASSYPGVPPFAEVDLGRERTIAQVNLVPYWHNTDFPIGFSVQTSVDNKNWHEILREDNYQFSVAGPLRADKYVQTFPVRGPLKARYLRIEFERLPLSGGNYAEVSQGYKARLSGIEVLNERGENVALLDQGASAKASDYFTGWQNTAKTVNESFGRIADIGVKWVRIGQWGDQTEWDAVEREKGKFQMDPQTDAGIHQLLDNGVDILYTLNYGNALYEPPDKPYIDLGPIYTEGHPFYKHAGPRTAQGRQAFVAYVDFVVRKYGDRIKWWELWNEENGWYPGFEPELYGMLLRDVGKHIKSINPDLKVMFGGTAAPAPLTTEMSLREGGAPYVDAYAFHPYGINMPEGGMGTMEYYRGKNLSQSPDQTGWKHLEDVVAGAKKPFVQHGRPDIAVWLDEWGTNVAGLDFAYNPGMGEYGATKYLMRFYIYSGWLNIPAAWWALFNLNKSQDWGVIDQHDYGFRPPSYALQNISSVVSDVEPVRSLDYKYQGSAPQPKVISYTRDGSGDTLVLAWAAEMNTEEVRSYPSKLAFKLAFQPKEVTLTDLYWGVSQPAVWSYDSGTVTVEGFVRDYPVVITCVRAR